MTGSLYRPGGSPLHRLAPEVKIVAAVLFTLAVVVTPREAFWAFGGYVVLVAATAALARIGPLWMLRRAAIELPFVALAVVLPFLGGGEQTSWFGVALSVDGLYAGWNIVAKGTIGVLAAVTLAATTSPRDLLVGLHRLRCPSIVVQIATFMIRYLDVLLDEARRMRVARLARGYDPRFLWQVAAFGAGLGSLFLRSFERGERVYLAMIARGYTGRLPV
jgi:cobalt/nickel transport system permease protein